MVRRRDDVAAARQVLGEISPPEAVAEEAVAIEDERGGPGASAGNQTVVTSVRGARSVGFGRDGSTKV
jgi:hypothetical protein